MRVMFRADASIQIGTGHVMRCLTLADALREERNDVQFICRRHVGSLIEYIRTRGYVVHELECTDLVDTDDSIKCGDKPLSLHAAWLGVTQKQDAEECKFVMRDVQLDWLVVDHYAIDKIWQEELNSFYRKLMVIDDLADRYHLCDLLLDQTYGRLQSDYQKLIPRKCKMLLGSNYALLRPEFLQWREYSLNRRMRPQLKNMLITMGGVDPNDVTSRVLGALKTCDLPKGLEITVVMGGTAPHLDAVKVLAKGMPYKTQVKASVNNMAEIMANADLVIGAAGTTSWERCCLGLPSILLVLAENQEDIANALSSVNAAIQVDLCDLWAVCEVVDDAIRNLEGLASNSAALVDGKGVNRTVGNML